MTENETTTFPYSNLAQQIKKNKTPIAVAIAEYVGSLMHNNPDTPYVFGAVKQDIQSQVGGVLISESPSHSIVQPVQQSTPAGLSPAQISNAGAGRSEAGNGHQSEQLQKVANSR